MYIIKNKQNPNLYWSEITETWTDKDSASFFFSKDDACFSVYGDNINSEEISRSVYIFERINNNKIDISSATQMEDDIFHCDPDCPFLQTKNDMDANCSLLKRRIPWYDWHIAICHNLIEGEVSL